MTTSTNTATVAGLTGAQNSLSLNVADSTRIVAPPSTGDSQTVEKFFDNRDIASMTLNTLNLYQLTSLSGGDGTFLNTRVSSLPVFTSAESRRVLHFAEPRPSQGSRGWQDENGTPSTTRPPPSAAYWIQRIPGSSFAEIENTAANSSTSDNALPCESLVSAFADANQSDDFGSGVYVTLAGGVLTAQSGTGVDIASVDVSSLLGLNVLPSNANATINIFGDGNPEWSPGMYISAVTLDDSVPPVLARIQISDANDSVVSFPNDRDRSTAQRTDDPTPRPLQYTNASFMVDQTYLTSDNVSWNNALKNPIHDVPVYFILNNVATFSDLCMGFDTSDGAVRLHDMIFGTSSDRELEKSCLIHLNPLLFNPNIRTPRLCAANLVNDIVVPTIAANPTSWIRFQLTQGGSFGGAVVMPNDRAFLQPYTFLAEWNGSQMTLIAGS